MKRPGGWPRLVAGGGGAVALAPLMASLSLILIAFFILFYSMTVIDERKKTVAVGSLQGSFGLLDGGHESRVDEALKINLLTTPVIKERADDLQRKLWDYMQRRGMKNSDIKVFAADKGVTITLPHRLLFVSGTQVLNTTGKNLMLKVANLLKGLQQVRYELFDYTAKKRSSTALTGLVLASLRATAVYRFMVLRGGVNAGALKAFGRIAGPGSETGKTRTDGYLEFRVIGGVPVYSLDGKKGRIKIGDFTFD